jgi:hypothetical protein
MNLYSLSLLSVSGRFCTMSASIFCPVSNVAFCLCDLTPLVWFVKVLGLAERNADKVRGVVIFACMVVT